MREKHVALLSNTDTVPLQLDNCMALYNGLFPLQLPRHIMLIQSLCADPLRRAFVELAIVCMYFQTRDKLQDRLAPPVTDKVVGHLVCFSISNQLPLQFSVAGRMKFCTRSTASAGLFPHAPVSLLHKTYLY